MDTGMIGLLKTCSGREDVKKQVSQDAWKSSRWSETSEGP
jgi:hypothetical protein